MQSSIWDLMFDKYTPKEPIYLIECFAGYGSTALGLKYLGVNFIHHKICEWAMNSIIAYASVHRNELSEYGNDFCGDLSKEQIAKELCSMGVSLDYNKPATLEQLKRVKEDKLRLCFNSVMWSNNLVDITKVKGKELNIEREREYLLTYSFPCQDLSLAGTLKGMEKGSGTRSGLLWEIERILTECENKPQILLMENVCQVHGAGNEEHFKEWQLRLEELGYTSYWQDISATEYGIPQTRNRCFMISILGDYVYNFSKPVELKLRLKDLLEENVDEKYYLSKSMIDYISKTGGGGILTKTAESTCKSQDHLQQSKIKEQEQQITCQVNIPENYDLSKVKGTENRAELLLLLSNNGELDNHDLPNGCDSSLNKPKIREVSNTITTRYDAGIQNQQTIGMCVVENIKIKNATKKGYIEAEDGDGVDISSRMEYHRGTVQKGKAQTLTTMGGENIGVVIKENIPNKVIKVGNYSPSNHNASSIIDAGGVAPTVMENHGTITAILENEELK